MKTLSQAELNKRKDSGATVKRKMGAGASPEKQASSPVKEVEKPKAPPPIVPSELAKALNALVEQHASTSAIVSQNSEVIKSLFMELAQLTHKVDRKPVSFDFKITRNRMGFMENITATPVLEDQNTH